MIQHSKYQYLFLGLIGVVLLACLGLYVYVFRPEVAKLYAGESSFLQSFVSWFYPRFEVEKQRFPLSFFWQKTDSIAIRLCILGFLLGVYLVWQRGFQRYWRRFMPLALSPTEVRYMSIAIVLCAMLASYEWYATLRAYAVFEEWYKPVFLLKILALPAPKPIYVGFLYGLMWLSWVALLLHFQPFGFSILSAAIFILLQGYLFSFHKIDHPYVPLTFLVLLLPLLMYQIQRQEFSHLWSLRLMQLSVVALYFLAGIEKVLVGGLAWFQPANLQTHAYMHRAAWGLWLFQIDTLSSILAILSVGIEVSFGLMLFFPKLKPYCLLAGAGLHIGIFWFLEIGLPISPWVWSYVVFYRISNTTTRRVPQKYTS